MSQLFTLSWLYSVFRNAKRKISWTAPNPLHFLENALIPQGCWRLWCGDCWCRRECVKAACGWAMGTQKADGFRSDRNCCPLMKWWDFYGAHHCSGGKKANEHPEGVFLKPSSFSVLLSERRLVSWGSGEASATCSRCCLWGHHLLWQLCSGANAHLTGLPDLSSGLRITLCRGCGLCVVRPSPPPFKKGFAFEARWEEVKLFLLAEVPCAQFLVLKWSWWNSPASQQAWCSW